MKEMALLAGFEASSEAMINALKKCQPLHVDRAQQWTLLVNGHTFANLGPREVITKVANLRREFLANSPNQEEDLKWLEGTCIGVLQNHVPGCFREVVRKLQRADPEYGKDFSKVAQALHQRITEGSLTESTSALQIGAVQRQPPPPNQQARECRYGMRCNNLHCRFHHGPSGTQLPKRSDNNKPRAAKPYDMPRCGFCKNRGHTVQECRKLKANPNFEHHK